MGKTISCSVLLALISCFYLLFATALDTITPSKSIKDPDVIISQNGVFRAGFFSLANSSNRYKQASERHFWILTISDDGNLVVSNGKAEILWSTNVTNLVPNATSAQLLDSGNLVLNNGENGGSSILWESFQHPSNVFLQTMKISTDVKTGRKVQTRSWKSPDDPSDGNFFQGIEPFSIPEGVIWNNNQIYFRTGPWNGRIYIVLINVNRVYFDGFYVVADDSDGRYVERIWDAGKGDWINGYSSYLTDCDVYGKCGAFGICDSTKRPICSCLKGFKPRNIEEWSREITTTESEAGQGDDGFFKLKKMKVPAFPDQSSITNGECKDQCMKNCSCVAYAYDAGIGCMLWSGDLIDVQKFSNRGVDLYIRLPSSELDKGNSEIIVITTVWNLWNEGNIWDLVDKVISKSESDLKNKKEIWRCIHVGLLCVQEYAKDRPTMSTIVLMLNSEISDLNTPKQPAFTQALLINDDFENCVSFIDVTLTGFDGR
ncbi:G-type lectin S-receptor-like serine/threonine-protein kinase SD1-13 [Gossypium hirsutum]|uniref:G-type lectin S-receptor-like serine/threonine-protein kinase SD1-13 n=1 Tax=Gossypium hirsutum TaxID=3635 RepID=A0ABM2ZMA8_GOSHI|nr:G-type lectin S-receptor-like serine/threonine-protein kinase SD1-13 [Gossypium hirsutum]